jgi:ribosomal protein S12 methylthiotransferase accessory factor YcaO
MQHGLNLKSQKKWSKEGTSRIIPPEVTLKKALQICRYIGVTRLADITSMDRLGIPNYSAVLPGTEDYIWVYSGKGTTRKQAKTSALMESIERYSSLPSGNIGRSRIQGTIKELAKSHALISPDDVIEPLNFQFQSDMIMDFFPGVDLLNEREILVPAPLVLFRYSPSSPAVNPFAYHHTNGLASGNVMEEAICHALCEVIERDASSVSEIRARAIPFHLLKTIENNLKQSGYMISNISSDKFVDDYTIYRDVEVSGEQLKSVQDLARKFYESDLPLFIKDITSDIGIPTFVASSIEWISHDYGYLAEGHGTHPDARIALSRAITEVSQTRAANIQGARDDLRKIHYGENNTDDKRSWQFIPSNEKIEFGNIKSYCNDDILDDIELILGNLKSVGISTVAIVDLTNPNINIPVIRAIVPGLETFKITKSIIGWRAKRYFRDLSR